MKKRPPREPPYAENPTFWDTEGYNADAVPVNWYLFPFDV